MRSFINTAAAILVCAAAAGCAGAGKSATFEARNEFTVKVPAGTKTLRAWFAMPQDDPAQDVRDLRVEAPHAHRVTKDDQGNSFVFIEVADAAGKEFKVVQTFTVTRREQKSGAGTKPSRPLTAKERAKMARYLEPSTYVVINDEIRSIAAKAVGGEKDPVKASRKLYDWVLDNIDYWVKRPKELKASPVGSSEYCLSSKTGNCTDFHSLWTSLARAAGIPSRIVYGSLFKPDLDGKDKDQSYHCWPEFYAPGLGWVPHDVAVADIYVGDFERNDDNKALANLTTAIGYSGGKDPKMVDYYFGNIDERRVTWMRGRDLVLSPKPAGGKVNALPKAYLEADGKVLQEKKNWTRKLTFRQKG